MAQMFSPAETHVVVGDAATIHDLGPPESLATVAVGASATYANGGVRALSTSHVSRVPVALDCMIAGAQAFRGAVVDSLPVDPGGYCAVINDDSGTFVVTSALLNDSPRLGAPTSAPNAGLLSADVAWELRSLIDDDAAGGIFAGRSSAAVSANGNINLTVPAGGHLIAVGTAAGNVAGIPASIGFTKIAHAAGAAQIAIAGGFTGWVLAGITLDIGALA